VCGPEGKALRSTSAFAKRHTQKMKETPCT
jgi:hypothetical protein